MLPNQSLKGTLRFAARPLARRYGRSEMKVVMQNGTGHTLNRREMEALVKLFPQSWSSSITKVALYHAWESSLYTVYYPKQKTVGLCCPMDIPQTKQDAINELLIAIMCIIDCGDLPRKLTKSRRQYYLDQAQDIIDKFNKTATH